MLTEGDSIALVSVFCSFALIFFLAFYFLRISGFDLKEELLEGKGYDLFPANEAGEKLLENELANDLNTEEQNTYQNYLNNAFIKICFDISKFASEFYKKQTLMIIVVGIFFGIFVLLILEEYIGAWYVTLAFICGLIFCIIFNYIIKRMGFVSCYKLLFFALENSQKPLAFAYYCGLAIIFFFLGFTSIFLMIMMAIYRKLYIIDSPNVKDYEKAFVLLFGGYTLGYSFGCLFYRGSSCIFQGGINTGAELLGKSDDNIKAEDQRNPCSLANRVADIHGTFNSSILDISCAFLFSTMVSIILICQSKEFIESKESFYFPFLLVVFNIIISYICSLFGMYFEIFNVIDNSIYTTKQTRFQTFITYFLNIFVVSFLPYGCFSGEFSMLGDDFETTKEPLLNLRKTGIARGWIIFCLLSGYLLEKILSFIFEYFSSHYHQPVISLLRVCENGPCLNMVSSNVLSYLTYPLAVLFISFTIFLNYGILGFMGVGFALLGLTSNLIPSFCICCVGALSTSSYKLGNLVRVSTVSIDRLFNISWASKNYCSHLFAIIYGVLIFGGIASLGALVGFLNNANLIKFKTLQIFGLIVGFSFSYLLNGIIIAGVQYISQLSIIQSKNQIQRFVGIRTNQMTPDYEDIFVESCWNSILLITLPIFFNILLLYLFGMLLGSEFLISYLSGFLLASSFIIFQSYISGNALYNSKILIDNTDRIQKEGTIYASAAIAELYSMSFKDSSPAMLTFIIFNAAFALLGGHYFDNSGYISAAVGLK